MRFHTPLLPLLCCAILVGAGSKWIRADVQEPETAAAEGAVAQEAAVPSAEAVLEPLKARAAQADAERVRADLARLVSFGTRHTLSGTESDTRGIGAARRWLKSRMEEISTEFHEGRLQVSLAAHEVGREPRLPNGATVVNVVGVLPGTDPDRLVVLSGHYDTIPSNNGDYESDAPGANDDGSGTVAVLEAARLLAGLKPRATVVFLCVAAEEQGLIGAREQGRLWEEQGKKIEAFMTMDIVGGVRGSSGKQEPRRLRAFSEGVPSGGADVYGSDNDAPSRQLARYLKRCAEAAIEDWELTLIFRQDRYGRGGDHRPFNAMGVAAIRLTEPHENYDWQHQDVREENGVLYGDRLENVDCAYVSRVAASVAAAVHELASAPARLPGVRVHTAGLTPHTKLSWPRGAEEDLAGYEVVYRRTHEPTWTHRKWLGDVEEVELEGLSKDDWLFGVVAVDAEGHRSLPVYPTPVRRR